MIFINTLPDPGRILLDANNTIISITSTNGNGFYFIAKIYIDNVLFDEQSWSRKNAFTAEKDLKKTYNAYFETIFNDPFVNGLVQQTHLIKKVSIEIEEHSIADDSLTQSKKIPEFFLMYNAKPVFFEDNVSVQFLGVNPAIFQIPTNGKISMPFMVNAVNESIVLELRDDNNVLIDSQSVTAFTEKRVYTYTFDLSTAIIPSNSLYFNLSIVVGAVKIVKTFRILSAPKYPVKEIAFLNNFGYWIYVYLDGQLLIENNFDIKNYEELDNTEKTAEINEKQIYTLNSGTLLASEKDIINQIVTALEAKIMLNSKILNMINATKKATLFKDRNNLYSENLIFSIKENNSIANTPYPEGLYDSNDYDSNDYTT